MRSRERRGAGGARPEAPPRRQPWAGACTAWGRLRPDRDDSPALGALWPGPGEPRSGARPEAPPPGRGNSRTREGCPAGSAAAATLTALPACAAVGMGGTREGCSALCRAGAGSSDSVTRAAWWDSGAAPGRPGRRCRAPARRARHESVWGLGSAGGARPEAPPRRPSGSLGPAPARAAWGDSGARPDRGDSLGSPGPGPAWKRRRGDRRTALLARAVGSAAAATDTLRQPCRVPRARAALGSGVRKKREIPRPRAPAPPPSRLLNPQPGRSRRLRPTPGRRQLLLRARHAVGLGSGSRSAREALPRKARAA